MYFDRPDYLIDNVLYRLLLDCLVRQACKYLARLEMLL